MTARLLDLCALDGSRFHLDAVDHGIAGDSQSREGITGPFEHCQMIRFRLDGVVYTAVEDPDDGYRSFLGHLFAGTGTMHNVFPPVLVFGRMRAGDDVVLELVDCATHRVVLEVGTEYFDAYYPQFVGAFHPEAMSINQERP